MIIILCIWMIYRAVLRKITLRALANVLNISLLLPMPMYLTTNHVHTKTIYSNILWPSRSVLLELALVRTLQPFTLNLVLVKGNRLHLYLIVFQNFLRLLIQCSLLKSMFVLFEHREKFLSTYIILKFIIISN